MARPATYLALAVLLMAPKAPAWALEPPLEQRLAQLDALRGDANVAAEVEVQGEDLLSRYKLPEDRTRIAFELAHVLGQSDIRKHSAAVAKYTRLALEAEHDPIRRGTLHSYLASALLVDPADDHFGRQRRRATEVWLDAYKELLALELPDTAPPLPVVPKLGPDFPDRVVREEAFRAQAARMQARREAERIGQLVHHRDDVVRQLAEVYRRPPRADDELKPLVARVLGDSMSADALLARVLRD